MTDRTILVADDNRLIRMLVKTALGPLDCRIIEAEDGNEALASIRSDAPDIVLLDVVMPKKDGFAVLEELHGTPERDALRVVMLTTAGSEADLTHGRAEGVDDYIVKPFEAAELRKTVAGLLGIRP